MLNLIHISLENYNVGLKKINIILIKKGFNLKKKKSKQKLLFIKDINKFINNNTEKKEVLLKDLSLKKKLYIDSKSYKGYRVIRGLPLHNQRTKTNSRTIRKLRNK